MYTIELVWNREFDWVQWKTADTIERAIVLAQAADNMGDGASVKKTRILDSQGKVVWAYGKLVQPALSDKLPSSLP